MVTRMCFKAESLVPKLLDPAPGELGLVLVLGGWHPQGDLVDLKLQTIDLELRCHDAMDQLPSRLPWQPVTWGVFEEITKELQIEIVKQCLWDSNKTCTHSTFETFCGFLAQEEIYPHNVVEVDSLPCYSRSIIYAHDCL